MLKISSLIKSFSNALRGVVILFRTEQSFRLQAVVAVVVLFFCVWLPLRISEIIVVLLLVGSVLILETINSIFERLVDTFKPRLHPIVGEIKDIMAAAVFLVSVLAAVIGLIIFLPHFWRLLSL